MTVRNQGTTGSKAYLQDAQKLGVSKHTTELNRAACHAEGYGLEVRRSTRTGPSSNNDVIDIDINCSRSLVPSIQCCRARWAVQHRASPCSGVLDNVFLVRAITFFIRFLASPLKRVLHQKYLIIFYQANESPHFEEIERLTPCLSKIFFSFVVCIYTPYRKTLLYFVTVSSVGQKQKAYQC